MAKTEQSISKIVDMIENNQISTESGYRLLTQIKKSLVTNTSPASALGKLSSTKYFHTKWWPSEVSIDTLEVLPSQFLIFDTDEEITNDFREQIKKRGGDNQVVLVKPGERYKNPGNGVYEINPEEQEDYIQLLTELRLQKISPEYLLFLWPVEVGMNPSVLWDDTVDPDLCRDVANCYLERGVFSVFRLIKAFLRLQIKTLKKFISVYFQGKQTHNPFMEAISGYSRSLASVWPKLAFTTIEISSKESARNEITEIVLQELRILKGEEAPEVRYEQGNRYIKAFELLDLKHTKSVCLRERGVYLITGGTGALGMLFAKHLAEKYQAKIVLLGRSPFDARMKEMLEQLKMSGSEPLYLKADVGNHTEMKKAVEIIKERFGALNGVLHAAGTVNRKDFSQKNLLDFAGVLNSKIQGTLVLDAVTKGEPLDFFVMFSSTASLLGDFGQCDYAIGNRFMDSYVRIREELRASGERQGRTVAINWPLWREGGMHLSAEGEELYLKSSGMAYLETLEGIKAFEEILASGCSWVIVMTGDQKRISRFLKLGTLDNMKIQNKPNEHIPVLQRVEKDIRNIATEILKIKPEKMDVEENMGNYGFDSISLKDFAEKLSATYKVDLSPTVFFGNSNLQSVGKYLVSEFANEIRQYYARTDKESEYIRIYKYDCEAEAVSKRLQPLDDHIRKYGTEGSNRTKISKALAEPVAIIGASGIFPGSKNLKEYWINLDQGHDLITEVPPERWDWRKYCDGQDQKEGKTGVKWGGFIHDVDKFDAAFFNISLLEAELMDPQHRLFLETVWKTIEDAGYCASLLAGRNIGIFAGVQFNDYQEMLSNTGEIRPQAVVGNAQALLANRVSYLLNFQGPSESINTACSSSLVAFHRAVRSIQSGESEAAIAGGISLMLSPHSFVAANELGVLSPDGRCLTFDKRANGYVRGEGVGAVLLKPLSKAIEDHDYIYAVIRGVAENHGGKAHSLTAPNSDAQAKLLVTAYEEAGVDPASITYIETHGTGTELGDPVEIEGLKKAFAELYKRRGKLPPQKAYCGLGSVKTNIGHLEPASGIAGIFKVLLSLKHKKLPGLLHFNEINPYIRLDKTPFYLVKSTKVWQHLTDEQGKSLPLIAGVSSFGFGGTNAHVVLEEYQESINSCAIRSRENQIIIFSARNKDRLKAYVEDMLKFLDDIFVCESGRRLNENKLLKHVLTGLTKVISGITGVIQEEIDLAEDIVEYGFEPVIQTKLANHIIESYKLELGPNVFFENRSLEALAKHMIKEHKDNIIKSYPESYIEVYEEETDKRVNLENIAYTLQLGREPMEERLALVVSSIKELYDKLSQYCMGLSDIENLFQGNIAENKSKSLFLLEGQEGEDYLKSIIKNRKYDKLAALWVTGIPIDWGMLYEQIPYRVPLPSYPFERTQHWLPTAWLDTRTNTLEKIQIEQVNLSLNSTGQLNSETRISGIVDYLKSIFASILKLDIASLDPDTGFEEYGINSLIIKQLNTILEKQFGKIPSTLFFTHKNLRSLARFLTEKCGMDFNVQADVLNNSHFNQPMLTKNCQEAFEDDSIAIIGMSGQYPMASDLEEFWENLKAGKDCIVEIPKERWDYRKYFDPEKGKAGGMYCRWGGFLKDIDKFDPAFFNISPMEARFIDPQERLFLQTVWSCIEDAGYTRKMLEDPNAGDQRGPVGVFAGVSFNNYQLYLAEELEKGNFVPVNSQIYSVANRVSYLFNFRGPSLSVDTACSSSLYAIHLACESIKNGECDLAIAGGVNLSLHPSKYLTLCATQFASSNGRCNSFGEGGDGYVPGEGVGALLLKPFKKAVLDGDRIYARILGTAVNHDGRTHGYTVPNPVAQAELIKSTIDKAKINPRLISYIEAHGTGTALGDPIEIDGLTSAFRQYCQDKQFCSIGSAKSNIGHLEAAAGIAGVTKVILQMNHKQLVPSIHSESLNPNIDFFGSPFYVQKKLEEWKEPVIEENGTLKTGERYAGVSSFGAGGVNVHVILGSYKQEDNREANNIDRFSEVSAPTVPTLFDQLEKDVELLWVDEENIEEAKQPMEELNQWSYLLLLNSFQKMGVFKSAREKYEKQCLKDKLRLLEKYEQLFDELIQIFYRNGLIELVGSEIICTAKIESNYIKRQLQTLETKKEELIQRYPVMNAQIQLLKVCLENYPGILSGQIIATNVIFPNSSMELVEGVYKLNVKFREFIAGSIKAYVARRCTDMPKGEILKIVEVGAGTGAISSVVLEALDQYRDMIEYTYTDISTNCLCFGEDVYAKERDYLQFKLLDVEKEVREQGFEIGQCDMVIAANVLHATKRIDNTLKHVKSLLKTNGLLIIDEMTSVSDFMTLTFGLLDGWWFIDDKENRIPGSPVLSQDKWRNSLNSVGFNKAFIIEQSASLESLIVAESDGVIRIDTFFSNPDEPVIMPISAMTQENLTVYAEQMKAFLEKNKIKLLDVNNDYKEDILKLRDIAYTMQVGREAMPYRLAFTARTLFEAIEKLNSYIRKQEIDSIFYGFVGPVYNHSASGGEEEDEEGLDSLADGKNSEKLARLWAKGMKFDWERLYRENKPRRVSLPTYPFLKERYWIGEPSKETQTAVSSVSFSLKELVNLPENERYNTLAEHIREIICEVLEFSPANTPSLQQGFFDMGMDSILITKFYVRIQEELKVEIYPTAGFDYPNISEFSHYLLEQIPFDNLDQEEKAGGVRTGTIVHEKLYYRNEWSQVDLDENDSRQEPVGNILVFDINEDLFASLRSKTQLRPGNEHKLCLVKPGDEYRQISEFVYEINPEDQSDYEKLIENLKSRNITPNKIIHYWSHGSSFAGEAALRSQIQKGVYSVLYLSKKLIEQKSKDNIQLLYLYSSGPDGSQPQNEALGGFNKTIYLENPKFNYKTMELKSPSDKQMSSAEISDLILKEIKTSFETASQIRYESGSRWVNRIVEFDQVPAVAAENSAQVKENGVYLIIGGAGGIGCIFANYLAKKAKVKLVLSGRSVLSPAIQSVLSGLTALGSEAIYLQADVTKREEVEGLVAQTKLRFDRINGVINASGLLKDSFIINKTIEDMETVLAPKVYGTLYLDEATVEENLDFFVMFSSSTAVFGNLGQCDYAYANSFMDAFANRREAWRKQNQRKGKSISINWPLWKEGGTKAPESTIKIMEANGLVLLDIEDGVETFEKSFDSDTQQLGIFVGDKTRFARSFGIQLASKPVKEKSNGEVGDLISCQSFTDLGVPEDIDLMSREELEKALESELINAGI